MHREVPGTALFWLPLRVLKSRDEIHENDCLIGNYILNVSICQKISGQQSQHRKKYFFLLVQSLYTMIGHKISTTFAVGMSIYFVYIA